MNEATSPDDNVGTPSTSIPGGMYAQTMATKKYFKNIRKRYGANANNAMYDAAGKMAMQEDLQDSSMTEMTDADMAQRENIVKSMKKNFKDFRKRYGERAKEVMYATATKMAMKEENHLQGSSVAKIPYKVMDMDNLVQDAIKDIPEDDGPHTSDISDTDAINFQTVANPEDVVNQPNNEGNREATTQVALRKTGKPFKSIRSKGPKGYGPEDLSGAVASVAIGEAVQDKADEGEYDYEGDMAKSSLRTIIRNAQMMHDMLDENTNLPEWVAGKVTLAEDYIVSAAQYMQSEMTEEVEIEEGSYDTRPGAASKSKRIQKKSASGWNKNWNQYVKNMKVPKSQRKSASIATGKTKKGQEDWAKHGNKNIKHSLGPYMGEEVEQVDELKHSTVSSAVLKRAGRLADVERDSSITPENKKVLAAYHKKKLTRNAKHELVHDMPNLRKMMYKKNS